MCMIKGGCWGRDSDRIVSRLSGLMLYRWVRKCKGDLCLATRRLAQWWSGQCGGCNARRVASLMITWWQALWSVRLIGRIPACILRRSVGEEHNAPVIFSIAMCCAFVSSFKIRKMKRQWYRPIRHYNVNKIYNICNSDGLTGIARFKPVVLVRFTISVSLPRITKSDECW